MMPARLPSVLQRLPPLPRAVTLALEVIKSDRSQRADLVRILSLDQSLTAQFLRMVNSAYYALPRRITSLDEAVGYLGFETVQSVIFTLATGNVMSAPVPAYRLERGLLWYHGVAVAAGAHWIAKQRNLEPLSDAYVAGLLHDVGKLVIDILLEHQAGWPPKVDEDLDGRSWLDVEHHVTGHDHAEVGAVLVRSWNLPDRVVEAVALHHVPEEAVVDPVLSAAVHVADAASLMAGIGLGIDGLLNPLAPAALERLNWQPKNMEDLMGVIHEAVASAKQVLQLNF